MGLSTRISFIQRSYWNLKSLDHRHEVVNTFGLGAKRKPSRQTTTCNYHCRRWDDPHRNDKLNSYSEVKLIDAKCLKIVDKNVLIKYNNGKEMEVKFIKHSCKLASETNVEFGDSSIPCLFFQSMGDPPRILAITTTEQIVDKFTDHAKLTQFLHKGVTKENEHVKFTCVWWTKGEDNEYKLTFEAYFKKVNMECKLDMSIHALKLALQYNIPIYVQEEILCEDSLRFMTATWDMRPFEAQFLQVLVNMRRRIAVAEGRFSDAAFWDSVALGCHVDKVIDGN